MSTDVRLVVARRRLPTNLSSRGNDRLAGAPAKEVEDLDAYANVRSRVAVGGITAEDRADQVATGIDMSEDRPVTDRPSAAVGEMCLSVGENDVTIDH